MKRTLVASLAALLFAGTLFAHHSFTATYDTGKTVTIEGKVTQFLLRNPHSFLHVSVVGKDGKEETWNVEWAAAGQLGGAGVTRESLRTQACIHAVKSTAVGTCRTVPSANSTLNPILWAEPNSS